MLRRTSQRGVKVDRRIRKGQQGEMAKRDESSAEEKRSDSSKKEIKALNGARGGFKGSRTTSSSHKLTE